MPLGNQDYREAAGKFSLKDPQPKKEKLQTSDVQPSTAVSIATISATQLILTATLAASLLPSAEARGSDAKVIGRASHSSEHKPNKPQFFRTSSGSTDSFGASFDSASRKRDVKSTGSKRSPITDWKLLSSYVEQSNLKKVEELVTWENVNISNEKGFTLLHNAAGFGNQEMVNVLLKKGALPNVASITGFTPLFLAAQNGHLQVVHALIESGAMVNTPKKPQPLHIASQNGHTEIVKTLIHQGAQINGFNLNGATALHLASQFGNPATVEFLIESGANVNQVGINNHRLTPLFAAALSGHLANGLANARLLIQNGADINSRGGLYQATALTVAASHNKLELLAELIKAGADPDISDKNGEGPMDYAILNDHKEAVKKLLETKIGNDRGKLKKMVSLAKSKGQIEMTALLEGHLENLKTEAKSKNDKIQTSPQRFNSAPLPSLWASLKFRGPHIPQQPSVKPDNDKILGELGKTQQQIETKTKTIEVDNLERKVSEVDSKKDESVDSGSLASATFAAAAATSAALATGTYFLGKKIHENMKLAEDYNRREQDLMIRLNSLIEPINQYVDNLQITQFVPQERLQWRKSGGNLVLAIPNRLRNLAEDLRINFGGRGEEMFRIANQVQEAQQAEGNLIVISCDCSIALSQENTDSVNQSIEGISRNLEETFIEKTKEILEIKNCTRPPVDGVSWKIIADALENLDPLPHQTTYKIARLNTISPTEEYLTQLQFLVDTGLIPIKSYREAQIKPLIPIGYDASENILNFDSYIHEEAVPWESRGLTSSPPINFGSFSFFRKNFNVQDLAGVGAASNEITTEKTCLVRFPKGKDKGIGLAVTIDENCETQYWKVTTNQTEVTEARLIKNQKEITRFLTELKQDAKHPAAATGKPFAAQLVGQEISGQGVGGQGVGGRGVGGQGVGGRGVGGRGVGGRGVGGRGR